MDTISAWLSYESADKVYIGVNELEARIDWQEFKNESLDDRDLESLKAWADNIRVFLAEIEHEIEHFDVE